MKQWSSRDAEFYFWVHETNVVHKTNFETYTRKYGVYDKRKKGLSIFFKTYYYISDKLYNH